MIEALILSYNALPMDVVSSYRAKAYCDHLTKFGIKPTLLTHRWEAINTQFRVHRPDDNVVVEETAEFRIIRLPYPGVKRSPSGLHTFWFYLRGDLDIDSIDSYRIFKNFLWNHLGNKRYDVIIAIYNPHFHIKLAYECRRKFDIPYVVDLRDLWDNEVVTKSYVPDLRKRVVNFIISRWWSKWIRKSLFFSTTGHKWCHFLAHMTHRTGSVIRNGIDEFPQTLISSRGLTGGKFKIIHFGRLYSTQDVDTFLSGFHAFAKNFSPTEVSLELVGLKKVEGVDYERKIRNVLGHYVTFIPYMPKEQLIGYCRKEAALFFFPNFKEDNGQFPVKLYDYIIAGKNIVVSPGGSEIGEFVLKSNIGVVFNRPAEISEYLARAYSVFKQNGSIPFSADWTVLNQFTRENQVKLMAEKIHSALSEVNG